MLDLNTSKYFNSLPVPVQDHIRRRGTEFGSEEELRSFVANLKYL